MDAQSTDALSSNGCTYSGADKILDAGSFLSRLIEDVRIYNPAVKPEVLEALTRFPRTRAVVLWAKQPTTPKTSGGFSNIRPISDYGGKALIGY